MAFYQQFESIMARLGLRRAHSQTQREFARLAADRLAASPAQASSSAIPDQVVDAFYRVRFSEWLPSEIQLAEIQQQLEQLRKTVP